MRGEFTILGIFLLAIAQWYASDSPRSRQIAYGLFGLAAAIAVIMAVRGPL
jgi:di/tricarboxylate transporter